MFDNFILLVVIANTATMVIDGYGTTEKTLTILGKCNMIFTSIFVIEMGLKIIWMGIVDYLKDLMNLVDGVIVALSMVEILFMSGSGSFSAFRAIRIFRTFRVVKVARLIRSLKKNARNSESDSEIY